MAVFLESANYKKWIEGVFSRAASTYERKTLVFLTILEEGLLNTLNLLQVPLF